MQRNGRGGSVFFRFTRHAVYLIDGFVTDKVIQSFAACVCRLTWVLRFAWLLFYFLKIMWGIVIFSTIRIGRVVNRFEWSPSSGDLVSTCAACGKRLYVFYLSYNFYMQL